MHSELMRSQSTHTTTDLSTLRTLRHLSRLDKKTRDRKGFRERMDLFTARFTRVFH